MNQLSALSNRVQYDARIVRFWNTDIFDNLDGVCETILAALEKQETDLYLNPRRPR